MNAPPVLSAGVACFRGNEILLVKRARPPRIGEWSLPGGRLEAGETAEMAALRELREETGVAARLVGLVEVVRLNADDGTAYDIHDFAAAWLSGEPRPGDDAAKAGFFAVDDALKAVVWEKTRDVIVRARALVAD